MYKTFGISIAAGLLGMFLALSAWHVYTDHQALHGIINMIIAQQQKAQPNVEAK